MVVLNHVIWQPLVLIVQMGAVALNSLLPKPIIVTLNCFSNLDVLDVRLWLLVEVYFSSSHSCRLRGLLYLLGVDGRSVYVNLLRLLLESVIGVFSRWHREVFMRHRVFVSCRDWVLLMIHQLRVRELVHWVRPLHRLLLGLGQRFYLAVMLLRWLAMGLLVVKLVLMVIRIVQRLMRVNLGLLDRRNALALVVWVFILPR